MATCLRLSSLLARTAVLPHISAIHRLCTSACKDRGRKIHTHSVSCSKSQNTSLPGEKITVHFVNQEGIKTTTAVTEGESLLDVVINKNLDISGFGACEGTLACSTCHLIFDKHIYEKMEPRSDEEMDMLDLAYGLTETSRLGCQVTVQKWMDGMTVHVPLEVRHAEGSKGSM